MSVFPEQNQLPPDLGRRLAAIEDGGTEPPYGRAGRWTAPVDPHPLPHRTHVCGPESVRASNPALAVATRRELCKHILSGTKSRPTPRPLFIQHRLRMHDCPVFDRPTLLEQLREQRRHGTPDRSSVADSSSQRRACKVESSYFIGRMLLQLSYFSDACGSCATRRTPRSVCAGGGGLDELHDPL